MVEFLAHSMGQHQSSGKKIHYFTLSTLDLEDNNH